MRPGRTSRPAHHAGRMLHKLNQKALDTLGEGIHSDGGGLYFKVREGRASVWVFIYETTGHRTELTLGNVHEVAITQARAAAIEFRQALAAGIDPMLVRDERRRALVAKRAAVQEARID